MARYHNSPNGPRVCKADTGVCPYGRAGAPHFENQAEAQEAYDASMVQAFGGVEGLRVTKREAVRQSTYKGRDSLLNRVKVVKASAAAQNTVAALKAVRESPQRLEAALRRADERMHERADRAALSTEAFVKNVGPRLSQLNSDYKLRYQTLNSLAAAAPPKLKSGRSETLTTGDKLANGNTVRNVVISGNEVIVHSRRPNGTIGARQTFSVGEKIKFQAFTKRESRGSAFAHSAREKFSNSTMYQRASAASELQRQAFHTLRGADLGVAAGRRDARLERRANRLKRVGASLKHLTSRASATQTKTANSLLALHVTNQARYVQAA